MFFRPNKRRTARYALVLFSLATVIGSGTVLAAVDRGESILVHRSIGEAPPIADLGEAERQPPYMSGNCKDLMASFLNPACHSPKPRKLHADRPTHQVATVVIGRTDAQEAEPADALPYGAMR